MPFLKWFPHKNEVEQVYPSERFEYMLQNITEKAIEGIDHSK